MPTPAQEDTVLMYSQAPESDVWIPDDDHIVDGDDISVGYRYRCGFIDDSDDSNNEESGIVHMVSGITSNSKIFLELEQSCNLHRQPLREKISR